MPAAETRKPGEGHAIIGTPLMNAKHEFFAQEIAKGEPRRDAYENAGFKPHRSNYLRLIHDPKVKARIRELLNESAERTVTDIEAIVRQLDEDRDFAWEEGNPAAAVNASLGKAKILGLVVDKHAGPNGEPLQGGASVLIVLPDNGRSPVNSGELEHKPACPAQT